MPTKGDQKYFISEYRNFSGSDEIALYGNLKQGKKVRATYYIRKFEDILKIVNTIN